MSVIATISVPPADVSLGAMLTASPGIRVQLERVVPVGDTFVPYLWAADGDVEAIETALRTDADVESFRIVDTATNEVLVRVEWAAGVGGFLGAVADTEATILEGAGARDTWRFRIRFDGHDHLTAFHHRCADRGVSIDLESVHDSGSPRDLGLASALTEPQRETLQVAFEEGYFDTPRRVNLVELADELGVSDSAVSQRLRRGIATLLATILPGSGGSSRAD